MLDKETREAVRYWRQLGRPMAKALELARADMAAEPRRLRYPRSLMRGGLLGARMENGGQWIEDTAAIGLRFVGFSNDVARLAGRNRSLDNFGYYQREDGDGGEVYRGAVYQLPARNGRPQYVPAVRDGDTDSKWNWRDTINDSAIIWLGDIFEGEAGEAATYSAESAGFDAASFADSRAERLAEDSREYDTAWNRGAEAGRALEEAREARAEFLKLRRELKARAPLFEGIESPAACAALQSALRSAACNWSEGKATAAKLASEWRDYKAPAFAEGMDSI